MECSSLSIHCQHQRYFCLLNYLSEAIWGPLLASLPLPSVYSLTRLNLDMKSGVPFLSPSSPAVLIRYTRSSIVEKQPRSGLRVPVDHPSPSYLWGWGRRITWAALWTQASLSNLANPVSEWKVKELWGHCSVTECLPSVYGAQSSTPSPQRAERDMLKRTAGPRWPYQVSSHPVLQRLLSATGHICHINSSHTHGLNCCSTVY